MVKQNCSFTLCGQGFLVLILLLAMIQILIKGSYWFMRLELLGFLGLALLAFVGLATYKSGYGKKALHYFFLLYIINLLLIWFVNDLAHVTLFFFALLGFLLATSCKTCKKPVCAPKDPHSMVFDPVKKEDQKENQKEEKKEEPKKVVGTHNPGKYVASARSKLYHAPKCEWAKKIKQERQLWFATKEEAWEKGLKAHNCAQ